MGKLGTPQIQFFELAMMFFVLKVREPNKWDRLYAVFVTAWLIVRMLAIAYWSA